MALLCAQKSMNEEDKLLPWLDAVTRFSRARFNTNQIPFTFQDPHLYMIAFFAASFLRNRFSSFFFLIFFLLCARRRRLFIEM